MDIWIGLAVAALKAGVSGAVGNGIVQALADQGIDLGSDKLSRYLEKVKKGLGQILTDKSLREMDVPEDQTAYIRNEIKELLQSVSLEEDLFRNCHYDAKSLSEALYNKYKRQKKDYLEYEDEIQKVLYVMSEKAISVEKERDGFTADSLVYVMNTQEEQMELLRKIWDILDESTKNGLIYQDKPQKQERNKRLPDRIEEYRRKWDENMFLNDFDEDDEDAGVNIPLRELYQPLFYRLKGQKKDLSNLKERLDRCTQGQDPKSRMILILGQPGMGKSTMITWYINQYQKKSDVDKKEMLVYRFTDLNIDWSFNYIEEKNRREYISKAILKCLKMKKRDLNGKILILDGFDEAVVGNNRTEILNCLYNAWGRDVRIKEFSLLITCRENYIEDLSRLSFPYIILQPWNETQIESFCREYKYLTGIHIAQNAIDKMKGMKTVFGIPIILYMTLALQITVRDQSSVVKVYEQIFSLKGGIYDRCLKKDASLWWDDEHRIREIKRQILQFSREISMWMFENNPQSAAIPQNEYEKIWDKVFEIYDGVGKSQRNDLLIGNYFIKIRGDYKGDTEELTFIHRSIYEYFVAETIYNEIRELIEEMTEEAQEKLAGVLGYRLKKGRINYTISQYLKAKVDELTETYSKEKKNHFYIWLEKTVGKMFDMGMLYFTGGNIKDYRKVIEKELKCFSNLLDVLRLFLDYSDREYILQDVDQEQVLIYIRYLMSIAKVRADVRIDLNGVDLSEADLSGANLKGAYLGGADLSGADLSGADLREASLGGTDISRANLRDADLRGIYLSEEEAGCLSLTEVYLRLIGEETADISRSYLRESKLKKTNLKEADLECSKWLFTSVDKYIDFIMQSKFDILYIYFDDIYFGEKEKSRMPLTRNGLLDRYMD